MTDNEIIKALEYRCSDYECRDLVFYRNILDLINRLQSKNKAYKHYYNECLKDLKNAHADIDRFENLYTEYLEKSEDLERQLKTAKAEAYKEFAERLKEKTSCAKDVFDYTEKLVVDVEEIDNLIKEMTEQ